VVAFERSTSALNFAFPESIVIFHGFDNIPWEYPFRRGQTGRMGIPFWRSGQSLERSMGGLILSLRSGRQCAAILSGIISAITSRPYQPTWPHSLIE
jgi:hypothetical protein